MPTALVLADIDEAGCRESAAGRAEARVVRCDIAMEADAEATVGGLDAM